mmetsp:Transcript_23593/g.46917  ORF Transcript_23593/g.46917 Transcript_23593/m.46917 type:complete len:208 (-) Transcript_23593:360-983(-)
MPPAVKLGLGLANSKVRGYCFSSLTSFHSALLWAVSVISTPATKKGLPLTDMRTSPCRAPPTSRAPGASSKPVRTTTEYASVSFLLASDRRSSSPGQPYISVLTSVRDEVQGRSFSNTMHAVAGSTKPSSRGLVSAWSLNSSVLLATPPSSPPPAAKQNSPAMETRIEPTLMLSFSLPSLKPTTLRPTSSSTTAKVRPMAPGLVMVT